MRVLIYGQNKYCQISSKMRQNISQSWLKLMAGVNQLSIKNRDASFIFCASRTHSIKLLVSVSIPHHFVFGVLPLLLCCCAETPYWSYMTQQQQQQQQQQQKQQQRGGVNALPKHQSKTSWYLAARPFDINRREYSVERRSGGDICHRKSHQPFLHIRLHHNVRTKATPGMYGECMCSG